ncbi:MAG TPA: MFS transporter [Steroidobacteraceae bacterium]|nr:MFS transporter [Steroidobacteraceae bacterium]
MTEQGKHWDTAYEWKAVTLLTIGFGLVGLDRWIIAPLFPAIAPDLHLNYQDAGNIIGALGLAWGVAAVVLGGLSDRIGRKRVLVPAIVLFSLLSGLTGVAGGLTSLLLIRSVMGVTEGAFCPTSFATTAEASKPSRRGLNQGIQQSTFALFGLAFAPIIATQLLHVMSWRGVFMLVAVPGLITAVLLAITIREPVTVRGGGTHGGAHGHGDIAAQRAPFSEIFKHRNVPLGMLGLLCAMTGIFVLSALTPSYLTDYLKLSQGQMGFVISAIGFGGFFGQFGLPGLSDLFGRRIMAVIGFAVGAVFLWLFINTGANPPLLFALLFGTTIFAFGLFALITGPIATEAAPLGLISSAAGIIIGAGEIFGGGVAPAIAGGIAQHYGIQYVPYFALAGLVAGAIVSLFLQETAPRKAKSAVSDLDKLEASGDGVV